MGEDEILFKTAAGTEELKARGRNLPPRLRTMLIMVDGTMSVTKLRGAAVTLGAPSDFLQTLLQHGLVESRAGNSPQAPGAAAETAWLPTEPERFRAAQKFMNQSVVDALGLRAFFLTLKLEKAGTCAELRLLLPDFSKAIFKGSGEAVSQALTARARDILG